MSEHIAENGACLTDVECEECERFLDTFAHLPNGWTAVKRIVRERLDARVRPPEAD